MAIEFPSDEDFDLYGDNFDYDAWVKREFGDLNDEEVADQQARLHALVTSLPANAITLLCCFVFWSGMVLVVAQMVVRARKDIGQYLDRQEQEEQRSSTYLDEEHEEY